MGRYGENKFGLHDMHGNVQEWCQDWYDPNYYKNSPAADPSGPASGDRRVLRGGSWLDNGLSTRSAERFGRDPVDLKFSLGFRVAGGVPPKSR